MVIVKINGTDYEANEGETILDVAKRNGIYIPTLCNHPKLEPFGACRICLVAVEGMRNYVPACATPVKDGMVVITENDAINTLRREILELILAEHPSACIVCEDRELCFKYHEVPTKAGRVTGCRFCPNRDTCDLYKVAEYLGIKEIRIGFDYKDLPLKRKDPFIDRDYNLCILCGRCVRICQEIRGIGAIAFTFRGHNAMIGTAFDKPLIESGCIFCGACVDVCPTGAISEKMVKWGGKGDSVTETICLLCPVGCTINVEVKWNSVINVLPSDNGINMGELCLKGRFIIPPLMNHADRLKYPMIKEDGILKPVSWEKAIAYVASNLSSYNGNEIGFIVSTEMTNEALYLMQKFAREFIGSGNIEVASNMVYRFIGPMLNTMGYVGPKGKISDILNAQVILVLGTDLNLTGSVLLVPIYSAYRKGALVVFVDKNARKVPRYAKHISPENYETYLKDLIADINTNMCSGKDIAKAIKGNRTVIILGQDLGLDAVTLAIELARTIEDMGGKCTLLPVWDGGNLQGAIDMGCLPAMLPGQRPGTSVANVNWENVRALYITQTVENIPEEMDFLIIQDVFDSKLVARADVVLPATSMTECNGTIINLERTLQRVRRCTGQMGMAKGDWEIITAIAKEMGATGFNYNSISEITEEIKGKVPWLFTDAKVEVYWDNNWTYNYTNKFEYNDARFSYRGTDLRRKIEDFGTVVSLWGYV